MITGYLESGVPCLVATFPGTKGVFEDLATCRSGVATGVLEPGENESPVQAAANTNKTTRTGICRMVYIATISCMIGRVLYRPASYT